MPRESVVAGHLPTEPEMLGSRAMRFATLWVLLSTAWACGEPEIRVPELLTVVTLVPSHGTRDVTPDAQGVVFFSHPIPGDTTDDAFVLECLGVPPCASPTGTCTASRIQLQAVLEPGRQVVRLTPVVSMDSNRCYRYTVFEGMTSTDEDVGKLPVAVRATFQTAS